jgi:hypothetical protein
MMMMMMIVVDKRTERETHSPSTFLLRTRKGQGTNPHFFNY